MQRYAYFLNVQIFLEKFCFAHGWPAAKTHSLVYDDRGGVGSGTKNGSLVYATRLVNSPVSRLGNRSVPRPRSEASTCILPWIPCPPTRSPLNPTHALSGAETNLCMRADLFLYLHVYEQAVLSVKLIIFHYDE